MTSGERAQQIWAVLIAAARRGELLTYQDVADEVGLIPQGVGRYLDYIARYCVAHDLPPLTILVVSKGSGAPGEGFTWSDQPSIDLERVYEHAWNASRLPRPDEFEAAKEA